jgi:hypothetical protein
MCILVLLTIFLSIACNPLKNQKCEIIFLIIKLKLALILNPLENLLALESESQGYGLFGQFLP